MSDTATQPEPQIEADVDVENISQASVETDQATPDGSEVVEMDWTVPQALTGEALSRSNELLDQLASAIGVNFQGLLEGQADGFSSAGMKPMFGSSVETITQGDDCIISIKDGSADIGAVLIDPQCASSWVRKLLGGGLASESETRQLTALESEVLLDCVDVIVKAVNEIIPLGEGMVMSRGQYINDDSPLTLDEMGEFSLIEITDVQSSARAFSILVPGAVMEQSQSDAVEESAAATGNTVQWMLQHLSRSDIQLQAQLGSLNATTRSLVSLEPGDVMLLDRRIGQSVEIDVQGIGLFMGKIVQESQNYALEITSLQESAGQKKSI